jgi:cell division protein ZapA
VAHAGADGPPRTEVEDCPRRAFVVKSLSMDEKPSTVHVEIFGQSYAVRAGADPHHVERVAGLVDAEMREVSRAGGIVDSMRIAVLAALNIADECQRLRDEMAGLKQRAAALAEKLSGLVG